MSASQFYLQAVIDRRIMIAAVSPENHWVMFENGVMMKMQCFLDEDKEPCGKEDAQWLYVGHEDFGWLSVSTRAWLEMPSYEDH